MLIRNRTQENSNRTKTLNPQTPESHCHSQKQLPIPQVQLRLLQEPRLLKSCLPPQSQTKLQSYTSLPTCKQMREGSSLTLVSHHQPPPTVTVMPKASDYTHSLKRI
ncbi:hypothetical protein M758_1G089700 [Ceratodon purpureus]|nr:hypothetical protein M758_1G089700 [Ceratodon purpureus]